MFSRFLRTYSTLFLAVPSPLLNTPPCREDMKTLLEIDPNMKVAREGVPRLEKLHAEKMEKMKDEAVGEHSTWYMLHMYSNKLKPQL